MKNIKKSFEFLKNTGRIKGIKQFKKPPIFIGGCGRSGTTLLLSILGAHPKIQAIDHEAYFFQTEPSLYNDTLRKIRIIYNLTRKPIKKTSYRWCEKTPSNILKVDQIFNFFDKDVKFIHIVRDGRDVITSKHPLKLNEYWVTIDRWIKDVSEGLRFSLNYDIYMLKYEDLVKNYDVTMKRLLKFLGEKYTEDLKNFHLYTNVKKDRAWNNSVEKINLNSIKKWEKKEHREVLNEFYRNDAAMNLLKKLGYIS